MRGQERVVSQGRLRCKRCQGIQATGHLVIQIATLHKFPGARIEYKVARIHPPLNRGMDRYRSDRSSAITWPFRVRHARLKDLISSAKREAVASSYLKVSFVPPTAHVPPLACELSDSFLKSASNASLPVWPVHEILGRTATDCAARSRSRCTSAAETATILEAIELLSALVGLTGCGIALDTARTLLLLVRLPGDASFTFSGVCSGAGAVSATSACCSLTASGTTGLRSSEAESIGLSAASTLRSAPFNRDRSSTARLFAERVGAVCSTAICSVVYDSRAWCSPVSKAARRSRAWRKRAIYASISWTMSAMAI